MCGIFSRDCILFSSLSARTKKTNKNPHTQPRKCHTTEEMHRTHARKRRRRRVWSRYSEELRGQSHAAHIKGEIYHAKRSHRGHPGTGFELLVALMNKSSAAIKGLLFPFHQRLRELRWTRTSSNHPRGSVASPINVKTWSSYKCVCFEVPKLCGVLRTIVGVSYCSGGRRGQGGRAAHVKKKNKNELS